MGKVSQESYRSSRGGCCNLQSVLLLLVVGLSAALWLGMNEYGVAYNAVENLQRELVDCNDTMDKLRDASGQLLDSLRGDLKLAQEELATLTAETDKKSKAHEIKIVEMEEKLKNVEAEKTELYKLREGANRAREKTEMELSHEKDAAQMLMKEMDTLRAKAEALESELKQQSDAIKDTEVLEKQIQEAKQELSEAAEASMSLDKKLREAEQARVMQRESIKKLEKELDQAKNELVNVQAQLKVCNAGPQDPIQ